MLCEVLKIVENSSPIRVYFSFLRIFLPCRRVFEWYDGNIVAKTEVEETLIFLQVIR